MLAPWWTHIGVEYNYQLHRLFHGLETVLGSLSLPEASLEQLLERLATKVSAIKLVHFSGEFKIWDADITDIFSTQATDALAERLLRDCAGFFSGFGWIVLEKIMNMKSMGSFLKMAYLYMQILQLASKWMSSVLMLLLRF